MKWMLTGKRHLRKQISLTTHFSVVIWYLQLSALLQSMQKRTPHISLLLLHLRWRHQKVPTHTKEICGMVNTKSDLLSHFVTNMVDLIYSRSNSSMFSTPIFCYSFPLCCRLSVIRSSETTCTEVPKTMHVLNHKSLWKLLSQLLIFFSYPEDRIFTSVPVPHSCKSGAS